MEHETRLIVVYSDYDEFKHNVECALEVFLDERAFFKRSARVKTAIYEYENRILARNPNRLKAFRGSMTDVGSKRIKFISNQLEGQSLQRK